MVVVVVVVLLLGELGPAGESGIAGNGSVLFVLLAPLMRREPGREAIAEVMEACTWHLYCIQIRVEESGTRYTGESQGMREEETELGVVGSAALSGRALGSVSPSLGS